MLGPFAKDFKPSIINMKRVSQILSKYSCSSWPWKGVVAKPSDPTTNRKQHADDEREEAQEYYRVGIHNIQSG